MSLFINSWHDAGSTYLHEIVEEFCVYEEAQGNETKVDIHCSGPDHYHKYQLWVRFAT